MVMVVIAAVCSLLAVFSGIAAIGSGRHWKFSNKDIIRGKRNAVLYVWVTLSTVFSLAHSTSIVEYGLHPKWGTTSDIQFWFFLHATIGLLLCCAHAYIYWSLEVREGSGDEFIWGPHSVR